MLRNDVAGVAPKVIIADRHWNFMILSFPPLTLTCAAHGYFTMSTHNVIIMSAKLAFARVHIFGTAQNPKGNIFSLSSNLRCHSVSQGLSSDAVKKGFPCVPLSEANFSLNRATSKVSKNILVSRHSQASNESLTFTHLIDACVQKLVHASPCTVVQDCT